MLDSSALSMDPPEYTVFVYNGFEQECYRGIIRPEGRKVDHLRKAIRKDLELRFPHQPITLYKCGTLDKGACKHDCEGWFKTFKTANSRIMNPLSDITEYFPDQLGDEVIHVVAATQSDVNSLWRPATPEKNASGLEKKETPRKTSTETRDIVDRFLSKFNMKFIQYLSGRPWTKFWRATQPASSKLASFIDSLKIPEIDGIPVLLLHDLESDMVDPIILKSLFTNESRFLVNTSGSGKTRLLFEGLCKHWGFYFTCVRNSANFGLGSADIKDAITSFIPNSSRFTGAPDVLEGLIQKDEAYRVNHYIAKRHMHQVLLARILVFEHFLNMARATFPSQPIVEFKNHWLILQLHSDDILGRDVFQALSMQLNDASDEFLLTESDAVHSKLVELQKEFGLEEEFFFILDEAQEALEILPERFLSADKTVKRPVLSPIIHSWVEASSFPIIVSGTGLSVGLVEEGVGSAIGKFQKFSRITKTGSFHDRERQQKYISRYMPSSLAESESGKEFIERAWKYARGRHRFTASLVCQLLRISFQSPHRVLNALVKTSCGFHPSDGERFVEKEGTIEKLKDMSSFDLSKISNDTERVDIFSRVIFHWLIFQRLLPLSRKQKDMVKLGFARFVEMPGSPESEDIIVIDEPLILLAGAHYFRDNTCFSLQGHVTKGLQTEEGRGYHFEALVAYALASSFDKKRKLCEIFDFGDNVPRWADQPAELVSVTWKDGTAEVNRFHFPDFLGSTTTIGFRSTHVKATADWFKNPTSLMCFPDKFMGPDIVFFIRLATGQVLAVVVQCKWDKNPLLSESVQESAVASLAHEEYFLRGAVKRETGEKYQEDILNYFNHLNDASIDIKADDLDGWFEDNVPMLRVVASYPAFARQDLPHYHATLNIKRCSEAIGETVFESVAESVGNKRCAESVLECVDKKKQRMGDS